MLPIEVLLCHLGEDEVFDGFSAMKLRNYYLLNPYEPGKKGFKSLPAETDRDSLLALMEQRLVPENYSHRIMENLTLFDEQIVKLRDDLIPLCRGLAKLLIIDAAFSRGQDNPQPILESMNSTGRVLSQTDLVRNFILMGFELEHQTRLYEDHWRPMEVAFGQQGYSEYFDSFMRHYLTVKAGEIPRTDEVYKTFKLHTRNRSVVKKGVDRLVEDIRIRVEYCCTMTLGKESDKSLATAFQDSRELKIDVAYPFLLVLYHDYKNGVLSHEGLLSMICLIESYAFRRLICAIPADSLNKMFVTFYKVINKERHLENIQVYFLNLPSYRRFPNDDELKRELKVRDFYNFRSRSHWLR